MIRRRSNDQLGNTSIFGKTDGRADSIRKDHRAPLVTAPELVIKKLLEDCNPFGGTSERLEARPRRSRPLADLIDGLEIAIHEQARMAPTCRYDRSFRR